MGGTLAIRLAEVRPDDVAGLVAGQPRAAHPAAATRKLLPLIARLTGSWAPIASDIKKPGVTELAYAEAADPGDDAAAPAVGGAPAPTCPGSPRR